MKPAHPGELIQEWYINDMGLTVAQIATALDVSSSTVNRLINGKMSVSPDMATKLEQAFQTKGSLWLEIQMNYNLWTLEHRAPAKT
jgi:addiction module HigA family antidote